MGGEGGGGGGGGGGEALEQLRFKWGSESWSIIVSGLVRVLDGLVDQREGGTTTTTQTSVENQGG